MALSLHSIKPNVGSRSSSKRVGRGSGSGKGNFSTRGVKGQRARTGGRNRLRRKGMKMILQRIPKLGGFRSLRRKPEIITLSMLESAFEAGAEITPKLILQKGLVRTIKNGVKALGGGTITKAVTLKGCKVSASAKAAIEKAGGKITS